MTAEPTTRWDEVANDRWADEHQACVFATITARPPGRRRNVPPLRIAKLLVRSVKPTAQEIETAREASASFDTGSEWAMLSGYDDKIVVPEPNTYEQLIGVLAIEIAERCGVPGVLDKIADEEEADGRFERLFEPGENTPTGVKDD